MAIYYPPTSNFVQKTLGAELLSGVTAAATLNNVTSIQNKKGVMIIDRIDANGQETPSKVEVVPYTGTSGSTVVTLTRGQAGTTDQDHAVGAIVEFGPDIVWAQGLIDSFEAEHNDDGTHSDITADSVTTDSITAKTTDSNLNLSGNGTGGVEIGTGTAAVTDILDEDDMSSDSATALATQQSIKAYVDTSQIGKNYIINGNFDVWQRGTTITAQANDTFIDDRWKLKTGADGGTFPTHINRRTALTTGDLPNSYYCHEINVDGAGSGFGNDAYYWHWQHIENGTRLLCGLNKTITVSFWAKSDIANKRLGIYLGQFYGTGGSPSSAENINGTNWTLTTTWTKYTHTFTTNTLVGKTFGTANDDSLVLSFMHLWGSTYQSRAGASSAETFVGSGSIFIAQVKLEIGDKATDFVPLTFEEELRACQRYYYKVTTTIRANILRTGYKSVNVSLPTTMRVAPTVTGTGLTWDIPGKENVCGYAAQADASEIGVTDFVANAEL